LTVKDGHVRGRQRYKCHACGKQFIHRKKVDVAQLYQDYIFGKQTLAQLSVRYSISVSSIRRKLDTLRTTRIISRDKRVIVLMDTTYWGRNFGVLVMKDAYTKKILWRKFVKYETLSDYREGMEWLENNDFIIEGIVYDGLKGIFQLFSKYRIQMCQFHQSKIIQRYLTKRPELPASQELLSIVNMLSHTDKESFTGILSSWSDRWSDFLKERSTDPKTHKTYYTHKRLRSAYLSLKRNMPYLWTWYDHIELHIPNTNNGLEGKFADLKSKLRNHNGLSRERRKKFIDAYFKATF
jgi:hypothetical protein